MKDIRFFPDAEGKLKKDPAIGFALRATAEKLAAQVRPPKGQTISVRAGVSGRGAFAQVIMTGPRAVFVEFGTRTQKAIAPLRNAIFGRKGV